MPRNVHHVIKSIHGQVTATLEIFILGLGPEDPNEDGYSKETTTAVPWVKRGKFIPKCQGSLPGKQEKATSKVFRVKQDWEKGGL